MVYDTTESKLNETVRVPWFSLPTIESELRAVSIRTFMCDCDVGEMFLNFMMEPRLRPRTGVDLFELYLEEAVGKSKSVKSQCEIMMMGFTLSPYFVTKDMLVVEMMTKGSNLDPLNVFKWLGLILNLLGMDNYDPTLP